ncbi:hypothetical protein [Winogradskyella forsetii]|uniref:hypothetical protein n=1 Tax=Winogradskyella forsetii TaxID=2686077 RepID=UPI0015BB628C|nr:hypothetical protein [Winogradskyella forsetii]
MLKSFDEIKLKINSYKIEDLLQACYNYFDFETDKPKALWVPLTMMKWIYLYGPRVLPVKELSIESFNDLFDSIMNFDPDHISNYIKNQGGFRAFAILHYQQFYLQTAVYKERFSTQLKLYDVLKSKYNIAESFEQKTGLSVKDFLGILQLVWLYAAMKQSDYPKTKITGYLSKEIMDVLNEVFGKFKTHQFIHLLMITPANAATEAKKWSGTNKEKYENMEHSFLTLFPFQLFNNAVRIVHPSVFNYTANYYIYDYMKLNDPKFTTEFGSRIEKYVQLGLDEMKISYQIESSIKTLLPAKSKVVDFIIDHNIFIECKAIEPKPLASINPTDDYIYSSYKDSLLKAYFEQILQVSKMLNPKEENWGIVITHKTMFWSDFRELFEFSKNKYPNKGDTHHLPPGNVFIMDIHTWDSLINLVSSGQITLIELLIKARNNNETPKTRKAQFDMQLDDFELNQYQLTYLKEETDDLDLLKSFTSS